MSKIRNIVFDMGKVLVNYDSDLVCRHFITDEQERKLVNTAVFVSPEWLLLDMGLISDEEALNRIQQRLETEQSRTMARLCLEHWHEYCMQPVSEMEHVIRCLKENGYGIYLCSNASMRLLSCYRQVIPGIQYFDGVMFSAQEQCIKPQKEIYLRLFEKFSLLPEECFFIDDLQLNIDGAQACGMDGYCHNGDIEALRHIIKTVTGIKSI